MYEMKWVRGHVEVFLNGVFQFSADSFAEAEAELELDSEDDYEQVELSGW